MACAAPFQPDDAFAEITRAAPYAGLDRATFGAVLRFVEDGGYALQVYERYRKLFRDAEGLVHVRNARIARQYRMNIGTIVEAPMIKLRLGRGPVLGEVEEGFVSSLADGDTFIFAGRLLRFIRLREMTAEVADGGSGTPKVPTYAGARLPLTTGLAARVRAMLHDPSAWAAFPEPVQEWLAVQQYRSALPGEDDLLVETFPRGGLWYLVAYCFEGRNAHQTLGMLLTRRMERFGMGPLGYVATDYVLAAWSAHEPHAMDALFDEDMMGDDLEAWMAESSMLRRTFRNVAVIAGLIDRQMPGAERNRRQVTVNSDLIYDVLRRHQPDHILLRATWSDAAGGLTDLSRLSAMLQRVRGKIHHVVLDRVSPLAVPVILEVGREQVVGEAQEDLLAEAEALVSEATGEEHPENVIARTSRFDPRLS
jgi:ATP-dependent Lhr-like helicase